MTCKYYKKHLSWDILGTLFGSSNIFTETFHYKFVWYK